MSAITKHRLFWPLVVLLALVLLNTISRPSFVSITVQERPPQSFSLALGVSPPGAGSVQVTPAPNGSHAAVNAYAINRDDRWAVWAEVVTLDSTGITSTFVVANPDGEVGTRGMVKGEPRAPA